MFDVMGTGGDREGFRRLSETFSASTARAVLPGSSEGKDGEAELNDALLYSSGLAEGVPATGIELPSPLRPALAQGGRPANRPGRRLAGLAVLYGRSGGELAAWARGTVRATDSVKALVAAWQVSREGTALIGLDRARELALNVGLVTAALEQGLKEKALDLYEAMPVMAAYGKTAFLESYLRNEVGKRPVKTAMEQQGLLAFVSQWCSRGGCGRCPLS